MSNYFNVYVTEEYEKDGEAKTRWNRVGSAFLHEKGQGMNVQIAPGIAVSGRIVILPPTEKPDDA